jgi:predicted nucleic acid-binding protein
VKLYLDSNALVSLYANDNPNDAVLTSKAIAQASEIVTSPITYSEVRVAFKGLHHNKRITKREYLQAVQDFDRDWSTIQTLDVNDAMALLAGALADTHLLKGCDAIHVATAMTFQLLSNDLEFLTFDLQLEKRIASSSIIPLWNSVSHG